MVEVRGEWRGYINIHLKNGIALDNIGNLIDETCYISWGFEVGKYELVGGLSLAVCLGLCTFQRRVRAVVLGFFFCRHLWILPLTYPQFLTFDLCFLSFSVFRCPSHGFGLFEICDALASSIEIFIVNSRAWLSRGEAQ